VLALLALHESDSQLGQAIGRDRKGKLSLVFYYAAADMAAAANSHLASEARPEAACPEQQSGAVRGKWGREDSNLRRQSQRVYSPSPLAAREHPQGERGL
jgi:hypothetical protein